MMFLNLLLTASLLCVSDAYSPSFGVVTRRSTMTMKRGRGSFKKEIQGGGGGMGRKSSGGGVAASQTSINWITIPNSSTKDLPTTDGSVQMLNTEFKPLVDAGTNPTGAVATVKYGPDIYCFSSSCPTCKIPLTKANILEPNDETSKTNAPRLSCDFCKATFNLKTGEKVTSISGSGFFGNIAKTVLSANESGPLPIYQLGEKNGNIVINIDQA